MFKFTDEVPATELFVRETSGAYRCATEAELVASARAALQERMQHRTVLSSPEVVKDYLQMRLAGLEHEVFGLILLDAQNALISFEILFRGTLTQTSVHAREIVKLALQRNAAAAMVFHNHPSGHAEPSRSDEYITDALRRSLSLVDVRLLDHLVVGAASTVSLAERGLL